MRPRNPADYDENGIHHMVGIVAGFEPEDLERLFKRGACDDCNLFIEWLEWAQSEPSSLRSFLWRLYSDHVSEDHK